MNHIFAEFLPECEVMEAEPSCCQSNLQTLGVVLEFFALGDILGGDR